MNVGQLFAQGVTFGAIYAIVALGYHLIYVSSGVLNFALGEQLAVAGLICLSLLDAGIPMVPAVLAATLVGTLLGVAMKIAEAGEYERRLADVERRLTEARR